METTTPFGLGGIARVPDARDIHLGAVGAPTSYPAVYKPDISMFPTHHQHKLPTCGANAFVWLEERMRGGQYTPRYSWIADKAIDGFALEDGTDMLSIFRVGKNRGVCDNILLPDDSTQELQAYSNPGVITSVMDNNAKTKTFDSYGFIHFPSFEQIKEEIYKNQAILALVRVGNEWWTRPDGLSSYQIKDIMPLRTPKTVVSGHFIVLWGYDEQYIYFKNSWGTTWAVAGSGYFGADYVPFVNEIGSVVNISKYNFVNDLTIGATGADVVALQNYLIDKGFLVITPGVAKGYFGPLTQAAVAKWQAANGITPAAGYFGPKSRTFISSHQ